MNKEKPPMLKITRDNKGEYCHTSYFEVGDLDSPIKVSEDEWDICKLLGAQRDADAAYYGPLIQQAREEERTRLKEEIEKSLLTRSEIDRGINKLHKAGINSGFKRREAIAQAQLDEGLKILEEK